MRLVPKTMEHGWAPYTWLAYFSFFLLGPIFNHASWKQWMFTALGTIIFLFLYFAVFWLKTKSVALLDLGLMLLTGMAFAPFNSGASTFFIFAAALIPFVVETEFAAVKCLSVILVAAALQTWLLHLSGWFLFYAGGLSVVVGGSNIYFAQRNRIYRKLRMANEEIERWERSLPCSKSKAISLWSPAPATAKKL